MSTSDNRRHDAGTPGVSVFLPTACRYAGGYLERAVASLLGQHYAAWELLAVDDGSDDGTREYLAALAARDPRVTHLRLPRNIGLPAYTLSRAWKNARAPLFAWLFDDCEYLPDHLGTLVEALNANADAGMAYGCARAELVGGESFVIGEPFDLATAATGKNVVANVCAMVRREVIDQVGWYDPHVLMKRVCDWDLWTRIARSHRMAFVDRVLGMERGTSLPQSLGRSCSIDMDLIRAYAQTDRDARLHPSKLTEADCYRTDLGFALSAGQAASRDLLLFEHALSTRNPSLARDAAARIAADERNGGASAPSAPPAQAASGSASVDPMMAAAAQLIRSRADASAVREIDLETSLRTALAGEERRGAEIRRLTGELDHTQALLATFREAADQRLAMFEALQARHAEVVARAQRDLAETHDAAQSFRAAADQRLAIIGDLQASLADAGSNAHQMLAVADQRLTLIHGMQAELETAASSLAALSAELDRNRALTDAARDREETLLQAAARMNDELAAARFRIDEARRVEASLTGRIAFWLDRTFGTGVRGHDTATPESSQTKDAGALPLFEVSADFGLIFQFIEAIQFHRFARLKFLIGTAEPWAIAAAAVTVGGEALGQTVRCERSGDGRHYVELEYLMRSPADFASLPINLALRAAAPDGRWQRDAVRFRFTGLEAANYQQDSDNVHANPCATEFWRLLAARPHARVLEIGSRARSGVSRREMFGDREYVGIDVVEGEGVTHVGDAHVLSTMVAPDSIDVVFSASVFEHLAMPWKVALEMNRVMKQGAIALIVSHQTCGMHDRPWDFWRFSDTAWSALFNAATGFEVMIAHLGIPFAVVPFHRGNHFAGFEAAAGFHQSAVVVRKIGNADASLAWDVAIQQIVASGYPE